MKEGKNSENDRLWVFLLFWVEIGYYNPSEDLEDIAKIKTLRKPLQIKW